MFELNWTFLMNVFVLCLSVIILLLSAMISAGILSALFGGKREQTNYRYPSHYNPPEFPPPKRKDTDHE